MYVIGGYDGKYFLNAVESYDPISGAWRIETNMPTKRSGLAAGVCHANEASGVGAEHLGLPTKCST